MKSLLTVCLLFLAPLPAWAETDAPEVPMVNFVFEGEVLEVGPEFAEKFQRGDVLSGTVAWQESAQNQSTAPGFALFRDIFGASDFIIDRHFIEITSGSGYEGGHALALTDASLNEAGQDTIEVFLVFKVSDVINNAFNYASLDIVLTDSADGMVSELQPPGKAPAFEQGNFRLVYYSDEAEVEAASGTITLFGLLDGSLDPAPSYDELVDIVYTLDAAVTERDDYIQQILAQLEAARARIQSLEAKVAELQDALASAQGTQLAEDLERQNAALREQLREASAQQAASAEIIAALKTGETKLNPLVRITQEATPATDTPAASLGAQKLPPMLARPASTATASDRFIKIPTLVAAPASVNVSSVPPAVQPEVAVDFSDESDPSTPVAQATADEDEAAPASTTNTRRGPRR